MCGIAGFYVPGTEADPQVLRRMCDRIRHRGPDDEGFYFSNGCGIGMRRLSIIDLNTGHQPISNEDGSIWVVFNGEIYNYQELRQDLISRGHRFKTNSDTETLIHLYEEYGTGGISKLRGMFAYAIWDQRKRQILLVRDRFGKKPLYYARTSKGLYFGSELKCLRGLGIPFEIDREALQLYFQLRYIPDPASPFRNVRKLPPASWLTYAEDGEVKTGQYWRLPPPSEEPPAGMTEQSACEQIEALFDESVRTRLISDVPLGAFLSGGLDSSSVVASMARQLKEPVKTFSIGFAESTFSELPYARMVASKYATDHHEIIVKPDSIDLVTRLVQHFDEPFADSSAIPTFIVSEFAARHVKVVLSGDGGDELFAGYDTFFKVDRLRRFDRAPQVLRQLTAWVSEQLPYSAYGKNYLRMISRPTPLERYFDLNYSPYFLRRNLLQPEWMAPADLAYLRNRFGDCLLPTSAGPVSQALYFEAHANLTGDMLVKVDRMSMANSLEVRCPLLDHRLAELAASIPNEWKMRNGQGKSILIKALGDRLPPEVFNRPKMGFGVPVGLWFRGPLKDFLRDYLTTAKFLDRGFVSPEFLHAMLDEHQSGRRDNSHTLWTLLILELWFRDWESEIEPMDKRPALQETV